MDIADTTLRIYSFGTKPIFIPPTAFSLSPRGDSWKNLPLEQLTSALLLCGRSTNLSIPKPWIRSYMTTVELISLGSPTTCVVRGSSRKR